MMNASFALSLVARGGFTRIDPDLDGFEGASEDALISFPVDGYTVVLDGLNVTVVDEEGTDYRYSFEEFSFIDKRFRS
jgi:hypothetical protein